MPSHLAAQDAKTLGRVVKLERNVVQQGSDLEVERDETNKRFAGVSADNQRRHVELKARLEATNVLRGAEIAGLKIEATSATRRLDAIDRDAENWLAKVNCKKRALEGTDDVPADKRARVSSPELDRSATDFLQAYDTGFAEEEGDDTMPPAQA